jgi:hypothetical protein
MHGLGYWGGVVNINLASWFRQMERDKEENGLTMR